VITDFAIQTLESFGSAGTIHRRIGAHFYAANARQKSASFEYFWRKLETIVASAQPGGIAS
jgi:hypothetical protein